MNTLVLFRISQEGEIQEGVINKGRAAQINDEAGKNFWSSDSLDSYKIQMVDFSHVGGQLLSGLSAYYLSSQIFEIGQKDFFRWRLVYPGYAFGEEEVVWTESEELAKRIAVQRKEAGCS